MELLATQASGKKKREERDKNQFSVKVKNNNNNNQLNNLKVILVTHETCTCFLVL